MFIVHDLSLFGGNVSYFSSTEELRLQLLDIKNAEEITRHHANYKKSRACEIRRRNIEKFLRSEDRKITFTLKAFTCDRAMIIAAIKGDRK